MVIKVKHGTAYVERIPGYGWMLTSIIVEPEYRRKGIGTQLMNRVLHKVKDRPLFLFVTSELGTDEKVLRRFYRRFGFRNLPRSQVRQMEMFPYNANMVLH